MGDVIGDPFIFLRNKKNILRLDPYFVDANNIKDQVCECEPDAYRPLCFLVNLALSPISCLRKSLILHPLLTFLEISY